MCAVSVLRSIFLSELSPAAAEKVPLSTFCPWPQVNRKMLFRPLLSWHAANTSLFPCGARIPKRNKTEHVSSPAQDKLYGFFSLSCSHGQKYKSRRSTQPDNCVTNVFLSVSISLVCAARVVTFVRLAAKKHSRFILSCVSKCVDK